jgi:pimeloyl-ACP methyl ester carboxylesterase
MTTHHLPCYAIHKLTHSFRSIVIIHGLNGDATNSWTNPETKAFWPKDFLPYDIPEARVLTFGYNAAAAFGNTTADIVDHAKDLLGSLVDKREEEDEKLRPIIFVAHSLGGIVVKQVRNGTEVRH